MKFIGIFIAILLVAGGIFLLSHNYYANMHGEAAAAGAPSGTSTAPAMPVVHTPVPTAAKSSGPMTLEGTAIMDTSSGTPAVPYIKYIDEKGRIATKQLIFADSRGCLPNAGDIPCVPNYPSQGAYPKLTTGEHLTVKGYMYENRFLVASISG